MSAFTEGIPGLPILTARHTRLRSLIFANSKVILICYGFVASRAPAIDRLEGNGIHGIAGDPGLFARPVR